MHSQCAWYFQDQKFHRLSYFWGLYVHEINQNQSRKTSGIGLPKFTTVNMARKCPQDAIFSIEKLFLEDYCFGSLMPDVFSTDSNPSYIYLQY